MQKDLVSVIIPVYNGEATVKETIESVLHQTYQNIEIIIVDDGSTDSTPQIIQSYLKKYENIKEITKPNGGISSARNIGIGVSNGEYICFCDADDLYDQSFVEQMYKNIVENDVDWVHCRGVNLKGDKKMPRSERLPEGIYQHIDLKDKVIDDGKLTGILISSNCTTIYKSRIIKENNLRLNETVSTNEDGLFNLSYFLNSKSIKFLDDAGLYIARVSPFKGKKRFKETDIFTPVNMAIVELAQDKIENFHQQMSARRVSIALWSMLIYTQKYKIGMAFTGVKRIVQDEKLKEGFDYIKKENLGRKKRLIFNLLKKRRHKTLFLIFMANKILLSK